MDGFRVYNPTSTITNALALKEMRQRNALLEAGQTAELEQTRYTNKQEREGKAIEFAQELMGQIKGPQSYEAAKHVFTSVFPEYAKIIPENYDGLIELARKTQEEYTLTPGAARFKGGKKIAEQPTEEKAAQSAIGKLIADRDKLPADSPLREIYDEAIEKAVTRTGMVVESTPEGGLTVRTNVAAGEGGPLKTMPATEVGKFGEFKAYTDTLDEIEEMVRTGKPDTGPFEFVKKRLDNWGVMPNEERIALRNMVARLPGIMYAMRGKQLSDKELEVALNMMPRMELDDKAFAVSLRKFNEYLRLILKGREKAFKEAGYKTPSITEPERKRSIDERGDELSAQGLSDGEVMKVLKMEGYY